MLQLTIFVVGSLTSKTVSLKWVELCLSGKKGVKFELKNK